MIVFEVEYNAVEHIFSQDFHIFAIVHREDKYPGTEGIHCLSVVIKSGKFF